MGSGEGPGLTPRKVSETGGVESYALTVNDLPAHSHGYDDWHYNDQQKKNDNYATPTGDETGSRIGASRKTAVVGSGKKHTNMPPYIALEFCIKR